MQDSVISYFRHYTDTKAAADQQLAHQSRVHGHCRDTVEIGCRPRQGVYDCIIAGGRVHLYRWDTLYIQAGKNYISVLNLSTHIRSPIDCL